MAKTYSTMKLEMGDLAPQFALEDVVTGRKVMLSDLASPKGTVVAFICNHCPYVKHILPSFINLANQYMKKGVSFVAISSNDVQTYPDDHPDRMKDLALQLHFPFPYLYDESQSVAKNYAAACTPDFYLFDGSLRCFYRGQFDESVPGSDIPVTGESLQKALDALIYDKKAPTFQRPSIGCNIKWKN